MTLLAQVCTQGLGMVGTIILARLLTPRDFGLVTMVLSFSLLLQNFGVNGFIEATVQKEDLGQDLISTFFWINVGFNLGLALIFVASAPLVAWFYKEEMLKAIVPAMAATILLAGLSTQHQALLIRNMEFHKTAACDLGSSVISLAISIALAVNGWAYWALVAKWVSYSLISACGWWILCRWRPGLPAKGTCVGAMLRFALNTYANFALTYLRKNFDKIIVGKIAGSQSLGNYDRANQLALMLPNQLLTPLDNVAIASFSRLVKDTQKYTHDYLRVISVLAFVSFPLSAALVLTGQDLTLLVLGPQWDVAGKLFRILGFSVGLMILYHTTAWVHLSLGTPDRWLRWSVVASTATFVLLLIGMQFGLEGIAYAYSASFFILVGPGLWYAGKPIRLGVFSVLLVVWKYFVAALVAGLLSWFILYAHHMTSSVFITLNILVRILSAGTICLAIYLALIAGLYQSIKPISQFISVLREMIPRISSGR